MHEHGSRGSAEGGLDIARMICWTDKDTRREGSFVRFADSEESDRELGVGRDAVEEGAKGENRSGSIVRKRAEDNERTFGYRAYRASSHYSRELVSPRHQQAISRNLLVSIEPSRETRSIHTIKERLSEHSKSNTEGCALVDHCFIHEERKKEDGDENAGKTDTSCVLGERRSGRECAKQMRYESISPSKDQAGVLH